MRICGFQKLTLLDFPGHTACTIFTGGCNLRCPFCHNALLVTKLGEDTIYDEEEIVTFLEKRVGTLDGVCVSGGEPLIQPGIPAFLRRVKALGFSVKLDTNGSFPDKLKELVSKGLVDYVAVDVKNSYMKYAKTTGVAAYDPKPLQETIEYLLSDAVDYEFRTTVVREYHEIADIEAISKRIAGAKRYFLQSFTDSGNLIGENEMSAHSKETLEKMKEAASVFVPSVSIRGV